MPTERAGTGKGAPRLGASANLPALTPAASPIWLRWVIWRVRLTRNFGAFIISCVALRPNLNPSEGLSLQISDLPTFALLPPVRIVRLLCVLRYSRLVVERNRVPQSSGKLFGSRVIHPKASPVLTLLTKTP
jgi:hypothetical protein